jgi:putative DNA primase/helicase
MDKGALKPRLREYLEAEGIAIPDRDKPKVCCVAHDESNPSMIVNAEYAKCFSCGFAGDVFKVAGAIHNNDNFKDQIQIVAQKLGIKIEKPEKPKPVSISAEKAKEVYTKDNILAAVEGRNYGDFFAGWLFRNSKGEVEGVDVRFNNGDSKTVVTMWYDGKSIRYAKPPVMIWNRDGLAKDKESPVLIVEGCKTAKAAGAIPGFVVVTWNGGTGKVGYADWSVLKNRDVYIYPDDDQRENLKWYEQPGVKAALDIKKRLPQAKICKPLEKARDIKKSGADIEEVLELLSPEKAAEYIISCEKLEKPQVEEIAVDKSDSMPFRVLGVDDYGRAYFIGRNERMYDFALTALTKTQMLSCGPLSWFEASFPKKGGVEWESALDYMIHVASMRDFDPLVIRGRGAWSENDGSICYHDGITTIGKPSARRMYIKKSQRDIGLTCEPMDAPVRREIAKLNSLLTYESQMDSVRLLAWSTLAPFAGALPWRPALLLTGPSASGKSTLIDYIARGISGAETFSGGETTEPGVRQRLGNDSSAVIIEESEADTKRKKLNRENLFSMMRQSTSNDAPIAAKGTKDGKGMFFAMRSMFLFVAIDPTVEAVADDNRIFRVNIVKASVDQSQRYLKEYKPKLRKLMTRDNCRAIRALVWRELPNILSDAEV